MRGRRCHRPPATSVAMPLVHLRVVWVALCADTLFVRSPPRHWDCCCAPKLHNDVALGCMSEACCELAALVLKPLRAAASLEASWSGAFRPFSDWKRPRTLICDSCICQLKRCDQVGLIREEFKGQRVSFAWRCAPLEPSDISRLTLLRPPPAFRRWLRRAAKDDTS